MGFLRFVSTESEKTQIDLLLLVKIADETAILLLSACGLVSSLIFSETEMFS